MTEVLEGEDEKGMANKVIKASKIGQKTKQIQGYQQKIHFKTHYTDFSPETIDARRDQHHIFKLLKEMSTQNSKANKNVLSPKKKKKKKQRERFSDEIKQTIYSSKFTLKEWEKKKKEQKRKLSEQEGHNKRRILGTLERKNR